MAIKEHASQNDIDELAASLLVKDSLPKGSPIHVNEVNPDVLRELKPHYSDWRFLNKSDAKNLKPDNRLKFFVKDGNHWRDVADGQQASRSNEWQAFVKPRSYQTSSGGAGASRSAVASANTMPSYFEPISLIQSPVVLDTQKHWVEFNIFDEDGKPVDQELDYIVRFDEGTEVRSKLKQGADYLADVPLSPFTIEIIPGDELNEKLAVLRTKLRAELDTSIAQVKADTAIHEKEWAKIGNVEAGFIYLGSGLTGAGEWVVDTVKGVTELATGIVNANIATYAWTGKYLGHRVDAFASYASGDTEGLKQSTQSIETMHKELGADVSEIGDHAETLALLAWDDDTRNMLVDFPGDYFAELSGVERTRAVARYGIDFLLIFVGGAGAGVLAIKNAGKISRLLKEMLALIKQLRFKQTVKKPNVDKTYPFGPVKKTSKGANRLESKPVKCFKKNPKGDTAEYDRQLQGQQDGLNNMTAEEYLAGRKAYTGKRASTAKVRKTYKKKLIKENMNNGMSRTEAASRATTDMKTLDALHNPDLTAGGKDKISDFGDSGVNRSIGSQWKNDARLDELDKAARDAVTRGDGKNKMNVKMERCK